MQHHCPPQLQTFQFYSFQIGTYQSVSWEKEGEKFENVLLYSSECEQKAIFALPCQITEFKGGKM